MMTVFWVLANYVWFFLLVQKADMEGGLERVFVQGTFDDFMFNGVVCVVRWSLKEEVFGGGQAFGLCVRSCLAQVEQFYGGKVRQPEGEDVKEEYLAVLVMRTRGTKRIPRGLYPFCVAPSSIERDEFHCRGVCRMTLYLPRRYVGYQWYREFRRVWCYRVRDECEQHFGSLGIVLGEDVSGVGRDMMGAVEGRGDGDVIGVERATATEGAGGRVVEGSVGSDSRVRGGREATGNGGRGVADRFASVGVFSRRVERASVQRAGSRGRDVNRLRALVRKYRLEVLLAELEFELAEMGESVGSEDDMFEGIL